MYEIKTDHMAKPTTVVSYIATAPKALQSRLRSLRSLIKKIAPHAEEKLSYGMPYYGYYGRLVYFAAFKKHIGLYIPPPIIPDHKKALAKYVTALSTVQFPHDKPLPLLLIAKLIKARVKYNEAKVKKLFG